MNHHMDDIRYAIASMNPQRETLLSTYKKDKWRIG